MHFSMGIPGHMEGQRHKTNDAGEYKNLIDLFLIELVDAKYRFPAAIQTFMSWGRDKRETDSVIRRILQTVGIMNGKRILESKGYSCVKVNSKKRWWIKGRFRL